MRKRSLVPSEHQEQCALMQWVRLQTHPDYQLLFAIPNGGLRNKVTAARLKKEGVKPGVPDLFWPIARCGFHGLYIEMKRSTGVLSKAQRAMQNRLLEEGYKVSTCYRWVDARYEMLAYHNGKPGLVNLVTAYTVA